MKRQRTGLASRIRRWTRERQGRSFAFQEIAEAFGVPRGRGRSDLYNPFYAFVLRGEIERLAGGRYRYRQGWHRPVKGRLLVRILKAMYLSAEWSVSDIMFFAETRNRNYIHRVVQRMIARGHIRLKGRRKPFHGRGLERVYEVASRERFRVEVL